MTCVGCGGALPGDARFCPACGAPQPDETAAAVAAYRDALAKLAGRAEAWAAAELAELRAELHIRPATHERLLAELAPAPAAQTPIGAWIDARPIRDFRAGEQCVPRLRIANRSERPIAGVVLRAAVTAAPEPLEARAADVLGPGDEEVLSVWFRPGVAGHHRADIGLELATLRGGASHWAVEAVPFLIGAAAALQQQIHIDAGAQRVGIFENIGGASKGGLLADADWHPVAVRAAQGPPEAQRPRGGPPALAVGHAGIGAVIAGGDPALVALDGVEGALVELHDPLLRGRLTPGDRLTVAVIGHDGAGRPLLSSREVRAQAPLAPQARELVADEGCDLAQIVAQAPAGARIEVRGAHEGPIAIERAIELFGAPGASIRAETGPVVRIAADAVLRDIAIRGAAPAGQYGLDAIEVRSGRVVLEGCVVSSDAPGNLVPGRAVAVAGAATVELRTCRIEGSGVAVAVDVSWSGFPTDAARGARVRVVGCEVAGVGIGVAVAGSDREVRLIRTRFAGVGEAAVRVLRGGACAVEDCPIPKRLLVADAGGTLTVKGGAA